MTSQLREPVHRNNHGTPMARFVVVAVPPPVSSVSVVTRVVTTFGDIADDSHQVRITTVDLAMEISRNLDKNHVLKLEVSTCVKASPIRCTHLVMNVGTDTERPKNTRGDTVDPYALPMYDVVGNIITAKSDPGGGLAPCLH